MHVCVMGAGIAGLACAYSLRQAGHEVTVVDRAQPGQGASAGNGAQLSYAYVQPLADPGIWRQLPKLLLAAHSPLKFRPKLDPAQWRWGLAFLAACNAKTSGDTTRQLLALAATSREAFDRMMLREQPQCDFSATGKLVLYPDAASFDAARRQLTLQQALGVTQSAVSADECIAIEPALANYRPHIAGAIHTPGECAADCRKTCDALERILRAQGVRFELDCEVQGFTRLGDAVAALATSRGEVQADKFVLSLGAQSPLLARSLGLELPVYPLKGYSITVNVGPDAPAAPKVSVTDTSRKTVFARLGSRLRVAGMVEVVGYDQRVLTERIDELADATRHIFPGCGDMAQLQPWTGMRPATPTGLPIVGRHPKGPSNLLLNTGHGALGFTLAFGTAERITQLVGQP